MIALIEVLKNHCDRYLADAREAREKAGLCDGLFGMGKDPRKDPCHERFYRTVESWTAEFLKQEPAAQQQAAAAAWILKAADEHRDETDVYWYLYAAQVHALPIIAKLEQGSAKELLQWYDRAYPARERMPVQDQVYRALKKAARTGWR
jgi:hypothetical protein